METIAVLFVLGLVAGFVAGLVGVGGGVLIVPALYFVYAHPELTGFHAEPGVQAAVAHATSLAIIVPTAVSATLTYHRAKLVAWNAVFPIAAASLLAAVVGVRFAVWVPAELLKAAFGAFLVANGGTMLRDGSRSAREELRLTLPVTVVVGLIIGFLSALLGVGGGLIAIPLLLRVVGLEIERVAATSIGIVVFTAVAGALAYGVAGRAEAGLPGGSWGYVHVLAALPILVGSLLAVRWGTVVNQRLSTKGLRRTFAVLLLSLGLLLLVQNGAALLGR